MLQIVRYRGESIEVGDAITVKILGTRGNQVTIGFEAPKEITVHRKELYERLQRQNSQTPTLHNAEDENSRR